MSLNSVGKRPAQLKRKDGVAHFEEADNSSASVDTMASITTFGVALFLGSPLWR